MTRTADYLTIDTSDMVPAVPATLRAIARCYGEADTFAAIARSYGAVAGAWGTAEMAANDDAALALSYLAAWDDAAATADRDRAIALLADTIAASSSNRVPFRISQWAAPTP